MGLLSTIKEALGLVPPVVPGPAAPFGVTARARRQLATLPGTLRVHLEPDGDTFVVGVQALDVAPPPGLDLPLIVSDRDRERLAGLELDHDGNDWTLHLSLRIHPVETPNPDVRLYETTRFLIDGRPLHVATAEDAVGLTAPLMAVRGVKTLLVRENAVSVEREPGYAWTVLDRDVQAVLRRWFLAAGPTLTQAAVGRRDDPAWNAVADFMHDKVAPYVHQHGGDIQLIDVSDGVVTVALHGACATCPASMLTLKGGVQRQLREALPDIVERVEAVEA